MADEETSRDHALRVAVALAERCERFEGLDTVALALRVVEAAEMIRTWLDSPNPATRLVLKVGPITEQPS